MPPIPEPEEPDVQTIPSLACLSAALCLAAPAGASETKTELKAMEGKRVLGTSGELLGVIEKVDEQAKMADLKTPSGVIVSLSTDVFAEDGDHLTAPMSRGDILAMIDTPGQEPNIREDGAIPTPSP